MKMQDVRKMARQLQINSFGKTKAQLIREIQSKQGNFPCYGTAMDYCDQPGCCFRDACLPPKRPERRKLREGLQK